VADIGFSFLQHYNMSLDGDMPICIVPADNIQPILDDPFGLSVLFDHQVYPNPNRYVFHWVYKAYFDYAPIFLQQFVSPIDSVYQACAIAKILMHIGLIAFLALFISGVKKIQSFDFIFAACLVTPLFQTNGYRNSMGIVDAATTYAFSYALPLLCLLLYFAPLLYQQFYKKTLFPPLFIKIIWLPLAFCVCFSGPLNTGIVLVLLLVLFFQNIKENWQQLATNKVLAKGIHSIKLIPQNYWFYALPIGILALYSLFLGSYNAFGVKMSLGELYMRLPKGLFLLFTQKLGFPILFLTLSINIFLLKKSPQLEAQKIIACFKWIGLFTLIYILLLPLGGYRDYRPYTVRYDTILPVTFGLIFLFGKSTFFLLKNTSTSQRKWYLPLILIVLLIYSIADEAKLDTNDCEKMALHSIAQSIEPIVPLNADCTILSWDKIVRPQDAELPAQLLLKWNITKEKRLFFSK